MKALTCEMCGSSDLLKENGVFVCQACGTKYSVEEAKKMMIEGPVQVHGTVSIDQSVNIENYLKLAESAISFQKSDEALSYAMKVLEVEPENTRAWLIRLKSLGIFNGKHELAVHEFIETGKHLVRISKESEEEVYSLFLQTCMDYLVWMVSEMANMKTPLMSEYDVIEPNDQLAQKIANCDPPFRDANKNTETIFYIISACPQNAIQKSEALSNKMQEIAKEWINFSNKEECRYNVIGLKNDTSRIKLRRNQLTIITNCLSADSQKDFAQEDIESTGYDVFDGLNFIGYICIFVLILMGILSTCLS